MSKPSKASTNHPERAITPELVREALYCVPSDLDRNTWVRLAMAIKAELGNDGFDVWDAWSQRSAAYDAASARDTWRSVKAGGRVTVGTLFGIAKDHGFRLPEASAVQTSALPDPDAAAKQQWFTDKRRQEREAEEAEYRERANRAASISRDLWERASERGSSLYLARKRVSGHGVRYLADGALLVPMRDAAGELQNVQRIEPEKPEGDKPEKRFQAGGRKAGLLHWIGQPDGAELLCLAEGYATAASVHEASGRPVAVCFDAGNLVHVAKALRSTFPGAAFLICGDDDRATAARTGKNPGREKAAAAVRASRTDAAPAAMVLPDFGELADPGPSDFNDLAAIDGAGPDEVRRQVEAAALALLGECAASLRAQAPAEAARGGGAAAAPTERDPADPFILTRDGVHFIARDADGNEKRPEWVCRPLRVTARTRSEGAEAWGYLLEFEDPDGNAKVWAMPAQMLAGDGSEWAGYLRAMGLQIAPGSRARNLLSRYIDTRNVQARAVCTDRVGWHGDVYVLPSGSIGQGSAERYVFQSEGGVEDQYRQRGTLETWQREVAALASGNSRLVFALCCAFAGPLLRPAAIESGGFHFRGDSSGGKTTALRLAASVYGPPGYLQRWRTTDNALEATAVQHSDSLLILDEFGQLDPKVAGECAYMLANEQEKGRATRGGLARRRRTWRLLFLSSGELGLAEHMRQAGKEVRAGQEVRFVDVPLDANAGMGGLETRHHFQTPQALVEAMTASASQHYGSAGRAWLEWLAGRMDGMPEQLAALIERQKAALVPPEAARQLFRIGVRFAAVAVAGELATKAGITGWKPGEAVDAVRACFNACLAARGHLENGEEAAMLRQVVGWLQKNGDALLTWTHRAMDDHRPNTALRAGFRRMVDDAGKPLKFDAATAYVEARSTDDSSERIDALIEYLLLPEQFRAEVCKGFDPATVARVLRSRGHLLHEKDKLTNKQRLPGMGLTACYHVKPTVFADQLVQ